MRGLGPDFGTSYRVLDALVGFGHEEDLPQTFVLAVSGGSDSMALLRCTDWLASIKSRNVVVLTVDHGLRPESSAEARQVAEWCAALGVEHHTLTWRYDGTGNLAQAARKGRYRLMAEFCLERGYERLYTGHTSDDQAETVLLRLARGSGVDGLSGMAPEARLWGITIMRPFVRDSRRKSLREVLKEFGQDWIEDSSNDDETYDRVKARKILDTLEPLGITVGRLSSTAYTLGLAREVLETEAAKLRARALRFMSLGYASVDRAAMRDAAEETALRVLADLLRTLSGQVYRPRLHSVRKARLLVRDPDGTEARTLHGCILRPAGDVVHVFREPAACDAATRPGNEAMLWDGRFKVSLGASASNDEELEVRALAEAGLAQIPKEYDGFSAAWKEAPREARLTTPALWKDNTLIAASLVPWAVPGAPALQVRTVWPASCERDTETVD